jgi:RNA polymerase sigma-70 factor (ECF subfamily)
MEDESRSGRHTTGGATDRASGAIRAWSNALVSSEARAGSTTLDELACLEAMRRGDPACLGGFFEAWGDRLYRLALRLTRDRASAEDVVQEAFVKLMAGADRIEGRSRLATWLYRVAYNASIDRLREKQRLHPVPTEDDEQPLPMPETLVEFRLSPEAMLRDVETREALEAAIATLAPPLRAAFLLRDVEGLSTAEAAEALEITETNLKVRLHRARLALRERLSAHVAGRGAREARA